jgi:hypothetical protein
VGACIGQEFTTARKSGEIAQKVVDKNKAWREQTEAAKQLSDVSIQAKSILTSVPQAVATTPGMAGLVAGAATGPGDQRAPRSAPTSAGRTPGGETPEQTPDEMTPATPAFTIPTVAQLAALSENNPVNQLTEKSPQLASMGRHGQRSTAPADKAAAEEAAPAGAVPTGVAPAGGVEGAWSGTEAAERAPIEVATGPEAAQEPAPVQRSV